MEKPISKRLLAQQEKQKQQPQQQCVLGAKQPQQCVLGAKQPQQCVLGAKSCALRGYCCGGGDVSKAQSMAESVEAVEDEERCSLRSAAGVTLSTNSRIK